MINKWFDFSISRGVPRYSSLQGIMSNKLLDIQRDILEMIFEEVYNREIHGFGLSWISGMRTMSHFVTCSKACLKVVTDGKYHFILKYIFPGPLPQYVTLPKDF